MNEIQIINPLNLSADQIEELEMLAAANYAPEDIAIYLSIDEKLFLDQYNTKNSEVRHHYDRGRLVASAQKDTAILKNATSGNITAYQESNKSAEKRAFENHKNRILNEG